MYCIYYNYYTFNYLLYISKEIKFLNGREIEQRVHGKSWREG